MDNEKFKVNYRDVSCDLGSIKTIYRIFLILNISLKLGILNNYEAKFYN